MTRSVLEPDPLGIAISRVAAGERRAFEELYRASWNQVFAVVRHQLLDPAQSEEVAQEVFLEVWRTAHRFNGDRGSAATWLATMARRRAIDRVRAAQSSRARDHLALMKGERPTRDPVAEIVQARFEGRELRSAMSALSDLQRQAISVTFLRGLTYGEAARVIGASESAIRTRVRDGVLRMRTILVADKSAA